jgi:hypothetical protein
MHISYSCVWGRSKASVLGQIIFISIRGTLIIRICAAVSTLRIREVSGLNLLTQQF